MIKELNKNDFKNIIDFETEEILKKATQKWIIEKPKKILIPFVRTLEIINDDKVLENEFYLPFKGIDLDTPKAAYGLELEKQLLFKTDLIQIYDSFILDLNKKLETLQKSLFEYARKRALEEKTIKPEQLDLFKKKNTSYSYPKTIVLPISYTSSLNSKDKTINLTVNIGYTQGLCIELTNENKLFLSELYFLIEKFDDINKYLLDKFPAGEYFKL